MDTPKIAAIYARVSTQAQEYDMQVSELQGYAARMGWTVVVYAEKMGSLKRRAVFEAMMADARQRKFDVMLVYKLDRFARSLQQLLANIQLLDGYGIRFVCTSQSIDTDKANPASRLMLHVLGAVAEFERAIIVERVRSGMAEAKRKGKHVGRKKEVWRRDDAVELRDQGLTMREIAVKLERSLSSVARVLKSVPKA